MEMLRRILLENPLPTYGLLVVVELAVLALWAATRRKLWVSLAVVVAFVAVTVAVVARVVVTDREQIAAAIAAAEAHVEAGNADMAVACLDDEFKLVQAPTVLPGSSLHVEFVRKWLIRNPVKEVYIRKLAIEVDVETAETTFKSITILESGEGGKGTWRLRWVKRPSGWRVVALEVTQTY